MSRNRLSVIELLRHHRYSWVAVRRQIPKSKKYVVVAAFHYTYTVARGVGVPPQLFEMAWNEL